MTEDELMDALHAELPLPLQPGELCISRWQRKYHLTKGKAASHFRRMEDLGLIERIPQRRMEAGKLVTAYRRVSKK